MTKHIKVTLGHIAKGRRNAGGNCPVFHALKDAGVGIRYVGNGALVTTKGQDPLDWLLLPLIARDRIIQYDTTGTMSPFEFNLEIPSHLV